MISRMERALAISGLAAALVLGVNPDASAVFGPAAPEAAGECSKGTQWRAEVHRRDGELQVEFKVVGRRARHWLLAIRHNGDTRARSAPPYRTDVRERRVRVRWSVAHPNFDGPDRFVLTAVNTASGERCSASIMR